MNEPQLECIDCMSAATGVHHGFTNGCRGCAARSAARGFDFARVRSAGVLDRDYRVLLDLLSLTHDDVKQAAEADALGGAR